MAIPNFRDGVPDENGRFLFKMPVARMLPESRTMIWVLVQDWKEPVDELKVTSQAQISGAIREP